MAIIEISASGGNFNSTATWVGGVVPTSSDDIIGTASSGPLTININSTVKSIDLTYYNNTITQDAEQFVVSGSTNYAGVAWNVSPNIILNGTWSRSTNGVFNKRILCLNMGIQVLSENVVSAYEINYGNLKLYSDLYAQSHLSRFGINGGVNYYPGTYSIIIPDLDPYSYNLLYYGTPYTPPSFFGARLSNRETNPDYTGTINVNCNTDAWIEITNIQGASICLINGTMSGTFLMHGRTDCDGATVSFIQQGGYLKDFFIQVNDAPWNVYNRTGAYVIDTLQPVKELWINCGLPGNPGTTNLSPVKKIVFGATTSFGYVKNISSCFLGQRQVHAWRTHRPLLFTGNFTTDVLEWSPGQANTSDRTLSYQVKETMGNRFDKNVNFHQVPDLVFDSDYTHSIGQLNVLGILGSLVSKTQSVTGGPVWNNDNPEWGPSYSTLIPQFKSLTASIQATINLNQPLSINLLNRVNVKDINFTGQTAYALNDVSLENTTGATTSISGGGGSPITTAYSFIQ